VTITGTNLADVEEVVFGGRAARIVSDSATQIVAVSPARAAGTVDIRVLTGSGTSPASSADAFTYLPAPRVGKLSRTRGPTAGGATVTITGANLSNATEVLFGGKTAQIVSVSATRIVVVTPARAGGTVNVKIVTAGGTSAVSSADKYSYVAAPKVAKVRPARGRVAGGTVVTITGRNLARAGKVLFGGRAARITSDTATQIVAVAPAGTAGTVDVTVLTAGGTSAVSSADVFTYFVPILSNCPNT
jgi:hypothetical protein